MPNPTVWAVTDPQGRVVDTAAARPLVRNGITYDDAAHAAIDRSMTRCLNDSAALDALTGLRRCIEREPEGSHYDHAGYRVAPMALLAPEALAVVEAAVLTVEEAKALDTAIVHFRNDAERFDASHSVLCEGIGDALRSTAERLRGVLLRMAPAAYRAATARDDAPGEP